MKQEIKDRIDKIKNGKVPEGYKNTKIGILPMSWDVVQLNDKFERILTKNVINSQNVLTISAQNGLINQEEYFNKIVASDNKQNYYLLNKGDFAYNKSYSSGYPFGAIKVLKNYNGGVVSPLYICFKPNKTNKSPDWYEQYFESGKFNREINSIAQEGARNHGLLNMAIEDFFSCLIPYCKAEEQQKIASILSTWDKAIELKEKLIEEKKNQKKGLMQKLLTGEVRFPEFDGEWKEVRLGEICSFENGKAHEKNISDNGKYVVVNSKFISSDGKIFKLSDKNISPLYKGDITMVMSDLPNGKALAKCFIVDLDEKYTLNQRICSLSIKKENKQFIYYAIDRAEYFLKFDNGVGQTNLRKDDVLNCPIMLPEIKEQEEISNILTTSDKEISLLEQELEVLKLQKKGLMQLLLTGMVRVNTEN